MRLIKCKDVSMLKHEMISPNKDYPFKLFSFASRNPDRLISTKVKNLSECTTTETVQLCVQDVTGLVVRPVKELKAFQKVELGSGETKEVTFMLTRQGLKFYTKDMAFAEESGEFIVFVGENVKDTQEKIFTLI